MNHMPLPHPGTLFNPSLTEHAYLFDLDGTLIELANHPDAVHIPLHLPSMLSSLRTKTGGAVAIISGRRIDTLEKLLPVPGLEMAGLHGLEQRFTDRQPMASVLPKMQRLDGLRPAIIAFAVRYPGLLLEDKGAAMAIHYRAEPGLAREVKAFAKAVVQESGKDLILISGKYVEEIRIGGPDKGNALTAIVQGMAFCNRKPVYFGDDLTDEAAFKAAIDIGGIGILVGRPERRTSAQAQLASCQDVLHFINRLIKTPDVTVKASALQWR
jgi:trehalose 6-phosphate phosphatase